MKYWSLALTLYIGIGLILSYRMIQELNEVIEDYENGKLDGDLEESMRDLEKKFSVLSPKITVTLVFVMYSLFWLPFEIRHYWEKIRDYFSTKR